jgi:putative DNA primase/helicase
MTVLPSGSRKSAVIDALKAPLTAWEKLERDRIRDEQARVQARIAVSEKRLEALKRRVSKATDAAARQELENEIEAEIKATPEPLVAPRLYTTDITHERYQQLLVEQSERISVITDEGGVFATLAGAYNGGNASIDAFLQGYSGTALRVDRGSRLAHVDRPALSFGVALQPGILADIGKNKKFRDSGLLARFLFVVPLSNVGERDVRAHDPIPDDIRKEYQESLIKLLGRRTDQERPDLLRLSSEALQVWLDFAAKVESRMGPGRELEHLAEWLAKLPGQAARVAGLLHLADTLGSAEGGMVVQVDSMQRAVLLAERAIGHGGAAFNLMGITPAEEDAAALLKWLKHTKRQEFLIRDVQRGLRGRFPQKAKVEHAIDVLREWNVVLCEFRQAAGASGGRPTVAYKVNPRVFT